MLPCRARQRTDGKQGVHLDSQGSELSTTTLGLRTRGSYRKLRLDLARGVVTRFSLRTQSQLQENILKSTYFAPLTCAAMLFACAAAYSDDANKDNMQRAPTTHPDFNTVDTHRHGYLTSDDVKSDDYVSKNFDRCNVKHNGHMSRKEYANCHE